MSTENFEKIALPDEDVVNRLIGKKNLENFANRIPEIFRPFLEPARYKAAHGGRGSGKSHFFAEYIVVYAATHLGARIVCLREYQKSLKESVKRLIEDKIISLNIGHLFDVQNDRIKTPGGGIIIFNGLQNHTADSIKSLEGFDIAWVEEAQSLSAKSLSLLRPTIRKEGSQILFSWNPDAPTDPVDAFLRTDNPPPRSIILQVNWQHNPYFPKELEEEKDYDKRRDPDRYMHVWEGGYQQRSESRVFHNWKVEDFETPDDARFLFGADWGFSNDPSTLIRGFIGRYENGIAIPDQKNGRCLFIDYEAYKIKCPLDQLPALFAGDDIRQNIPKEKRWPNPQGFKGIPQATEWPIRADNARPETIDHMQRNGFPRMVRSTKGPNSVNDGVEFIKSYDVIIHPRCKHTETEFMSYSYETDPQTEEVLPKLKDKDNHIIDPIRYMLELVRKATRTSGKTAPTGGKAL